MRFLHKKHISILFLFSIFFFISCSKESDDPNPTETTVATSDFSKTMDENPTNGQVIGNVQGSTNNGTVTFSIAEQNPSGAFSIDAASGEMKVANAMLFDFETNPTITGTVKVANGAIFKNALVTVILSDIDEENVYEGDVYLKTQDEVNSFGAYHYTHITGLLSIGDPYETGSSNISDLSPLNSIERIDGSIQFIKNPILTTTAGLNVHYIGELVAVMDNPLLERVEGLNGITSVLHLFLSDNDILSNLSGLTQLTSIEYNLSIVSCPLLPNLDWLSNLRSTKSLTIRKCHSLRNVDGLNGLSSITNETGTIWISNNNSLENLNGLQNFDGTLSTLDIYDNPSLLSINGLRNLNVFNDVTIRNNNLLQSLQGLGKIIYLNNGPTIQNNNSLIDLQGLTNLKASNFRITVKNNQNLVSLNGIENMTHIWAIDLLDNPKLSDFCSLQNILTVDVSTGYSAQGNAYNPTKQDIIDGNCRL